MASVTQVTESSGYRRCYPPPSIPHTTATHLDALYVMHHARCRHRSGLFEWRSRRVQSTTDRRDTAVHVYLTLTLTAPVALTPPSPPPSLSSPHTSP